jgi:O-antigen/teichoic acid export membrane protein
VKFSIGLSILVQGYVTLLGIVLMPVYLHHLGSEAFGLVGLFLIAQSLIQILDMGLTPALTRDMSRMRAGSLAPQEAVLRLQSMEWLMGLVALSLITAIWLASEPISRHWIHANDLPPSTIAFCISLIGGAIALRWLAGLYRGVMVGLEQQSRVNTVSAIFATLRFAGPIPLLVLISASPKDFFAFQVIVSAVELLVYGVLARLHLPVTKPRHPSLSPLKDMLHIVGNMAFLNAMWVILTQLDKLILSGMLSLEDYGNFTLATAAAGSVLILVPSMNQIIQPRLCFLFARGETVALQSLYRLASQLGVIGFVTLGSGLAFFSEVIIYLWTGSKMIAQTSAPILFWYALANSAVGITLVPFMLQFAKGQLGLHVIGNVILLLALIPALVIAAYQYGALGAGLAFFTANTLFLLAWLPVVHRRFLPELTWRWLLTDTLPVAIVIASLLALAARWMPDRLGLPLSVVWIGCSMMVAAMVGVGIGGHARRFALKTLTVARKA